MRSSDVKWTESDIPNLYGRLAVVTGANSGIGFEATRALASHGAHVLMAVRSVERGETAKNELLQQIPNANLDVLALDLSDLESVRRFATLFLKQFSKLSLLVNNAGAMGGPYQKTKDGFELQFGTNHLGHFALTGLLLPALFEAEQARVVNVSSRAHEGARLDFNDLHGAHGYRRWRAYGRSKLANLLFTYELQRRLTASGRPLLSVACHPGWAATNLASKSVGTRQGIGNIVQNMFNVGAQSAAMGALPTLYAAVAPTIHGGEYIGPTGFLGMRGYPGVVSSSKWSHDETDAQRLWAVSEQLTNVRYEALGAGVI